MGLGSTPFTFMKDEDKIDSVAEKETYVGSNELTQEEARGLAWLKGRVGIPRGVYRFNSHEEADAWEQKMLTFNKK